ncbi:hypothetical protein KAU11_08975 [Candidatus Babeliales bacterium]|nr:hypothetical protein [Candidatus Babeliales bacterium]
MTENEFIITGLSLVSIFFFALFLITYRAYNRLFKKKLASVLPTAAPTIIEEDKYDITDIVFNTSYSGGSHIPKELLLSRLKEKAGIRFLAKIEEMGDLDVFVEKNENQHPMNKNVSFKIKVAIKK